MKKLFDSISNINQIIDEKFLLYQIIIDLIMFAIIEIKSNIINAISIINRFV